MYSLNSFLPINVLHYFKCWELSRKSASYTLLENSYKITFFAEFVLSSSFLLSKSGTPNLPLPSSSCPCVGTPVSSSCPCVGTPVRAHWETGRQKMPRDASIHLPLWSVYPDHQTVYLRLPQQLASLFLTTDANLTQTASTLHCENLFSVSPTPAVHGSSSEGLLILMW